MIGIGGARALIGISGGRGLSGERRFGVTYLSINHAAR